MADIVTLGELASFLRVDPARVVGYQIHLDLATGLVTDEIGVLSPWPTAAKTTVLAAVARAYYNPEGLKSETTGGHTAVRDAAALGVYLTDADLEKLHRPVGGTAAAAAGPAGDFPDALCWPDPVGRWVSGFGS